MGFVTNSVLSNTFSDKIFCRKNLKPFSDEVSVDEFSLAPTFSFGALSSTQHIAMKSNFRR